MVPELPSLTRRRLLAGVAGAVGGGTVAVGATEPTALPDRLTDQATKYYPTPPEVDEQWRPTVTEEHARTAVERLARIAERGEKLWSQIDADRRYFGAAGRLERARERLADGNYHGALRDARSGMGFAAEGVGFARKRLGRADVTELVARTTRLAEGLDDRAAAIQPYPVTDPARDLAWYYRIDRELYFARLTGPWNGYERLREQLETDGEDDSDAITAGYDAHDIGRIWDGLVSAEQSLENARRFHDQLRGKLGDDASPAEPHLRKTIRSFRSAVESYPTKAEVESSFLPDGDDGYTSDDPYLSARLHLTRWCFDTDYRVALDAGLPLTAYNVVQLSTALAERRAHEFALDNLVVEKGQSGFDSGHTLAEKRRARRTYRRVIGDDPPPILTRMARRAIEDLQVAKVGFAGGEYPLWKDRLEAYLYALIGRAKLREYPKLFDTVVGGL